jgi:predicted CopG family antitoxin
MLKSIKIDETTKEKLDKVKHPGQSYDGIIRELAELWEDIKKAGDVRIKVGKR